MSGEEQERFEDYLELERYIEGLQAGHVVYPPEGLTPEQARIYRMAALFRSVSPEAAEPRPEFAEELRARLHLLALGEEVLEEDTQKRPAIGRPAVQAQPEVPVAASIDNAKQEHEFIAPPPSEVPQHPPAPTAPQPPMPRKAHFVSRRALLTGGAVAAASLAVGAGMGSALKPAGPTSPPPLSPYITTDLVPKSKVPGTQSTMWQPVANLAELGDQAVKFVTDAVIGYVIINDGDDSTELKKGDIVAMSAACTHMGCIVQWNSADRHFHCPCHNGLFTEYGKPPNPHADPRSTHYLAPLPRLKTKVENGTIYVEVPNNTQAPKKTTS